MSARSTIGRARGDAGFTLVELLVVAAISFVVLGAAMTLVTSLMRQRVDTERHAESARQVRLAADRLARQLRNLASPADVITTTGSEQPRSVDRNLPFDLVFKDVAEGALTSPLGNPANVRRVRYCLQTSGPVPGGGTATTSSARVWVQLQQTSAALPTLPAAPPADLACPGAGWTSSSIAAANVTNAAPATPRAAFRYSNALGPVTQTDATARERITRIEADLFVDPDPAAAPREARLTTSVALRNQNRPPTAAFDVTALVNCTAQLNGSASDDPEGKRLTYTWWVDDVKLPAALQDRILVQTTVTPGSHVFRLDVADPSGLPATPATVTRTIC